MLEQSNPVPPTGCDPLAVFKAKVATLRNAIQTMTATAGGVDRAYVLKRQQIAGLRTKLAAKKLKLAGCAKPTRKPTAKPTANPAEKPCDTQAIYLAKADALLGAIKTLVRTAGQAATKYAEKKNYIAELTAKFAAAKGKLAVGCTTTTDEPTTTTTSITTTPGPTCSTVLTVCQHYRKCCQEYRLDARRSALCSEARSTLEVGSGCAKKKTTTDQLSFSTMPATVTTTTTTPAPAPVTTAVTTTTTAAITTTTATSNTPTTTTTASTTTTTATAVTAATTTATATTSTATATATTTTTATPTTASTLPPLKKIGEEKSVEDPTAAQSNPIADAAKGNEPLQKNEGGGAGSEASSSGDGGVAAAVSTLFILAAIVIAIVAAVLVKRRNSTKDERKTSEEGQPWDAPIDTLPPQASQNGVTPDYRLDGQNPGPLYTAPAEGAVDDCLYDAIGEAAMSAAADNASYDVAESMAAIAMNHTTDPVYDMGATAHADTSTATGAIEPATYDTAAALGAASAGTRGSAAAMYDVCGRVNNTNNTTDDQALYATADGLDGVADGVDLGTDALYDSATPADTDATYCVAEQERLPAFGSFGSTKANLSEFGEQSIIFDSTEDLLATVDAETDGVGMENPVYEGAKEGARDGFDIVSAAAIMHSSTHSKSSQAEKEWTENLQNAFVLDTDATSVRLKSARRENPLFRNSIALKGGTDDDDIAEHDSKPVESSNSFETVSQEPVGYGQYAKAEGDGVMYTPTTSKSSMGERTKSYEGALHVVDKSDGALA